MEGQEYSIEVKDVRKTFKVYHDKGHTLKEKSLHVSRNKYEVREVLKGISFQVKRGEALGLIGHNGCGKSTTLKLLTRIMYPDSGSIKMRGRVSSLLELGAGFHPDMSGIENIYINASIFGLSKKEIDGKLDSIIEFAELGDYINNPVRTYSSGMYMRLAFSVAINVNADVLLIDEILAVGDVNFQAKCYNKLMEIREQGTTIVLVSHSMDQVERVCGRCIWLQDGEIKMDGTPQEVNSAYLTHMSRKRKESAQEQLETKNKKKDEQIKEQGQDAREGATAQEQENNKKSEEAAPQEVERRGTGEVRITEVKCYDSAGQESYYLDSEEDVQFIIKYHVNKPIKNAAFGLCIYRNDGVRCYGVNTRADELPLVELKEDGEAVMTFRRILLLGGSYTADVTIEMETGDTVDYFDKVVRFEIYSKRKCSGVAWLEHSWRI